VREARDKGKGGGGFDHVIGLSARLWLPSKNLKVVLRLRRRRRRRRKWRRRRREWKRRRRRRRRSKPTD
jgi:hypothetical protein